MFSKILIIVAVVGVAAVSAAQPASAAGWRVAGRASDSSPSLTSVLVSSDSDDVTLGRVTIRATKGNKVSVNTRRTCLRTTEPTRTVSNTKHTNYRSTGMPISWMLGPTFVDAEFCWFSVDAWASTGGRLSVVLEVQ
jgi:hypothetical protein